MLNVDELKQAIQNKDAAKIASLVKQYGLTIENNKISASDENCNQMTGFWDKRQLVKKINLNSLNFGRVYQ